MVLTLADLSQLQVETTDLSERDVAQIAIDQPATLYIEALNVEISGRVARIAAQVNLIGGDVVYPVLVAYQDIVAFFRAFSRGRASIFRYDVLIGDRC